MDAPDGPAVVMCQAVGRNDGAGTTRLTRYASVTEAIAAASVRPCDNPHCHGNHVVAWCKGRVYDVAGPGTGNARWHTLVGVEIFDQRVRRSLAEEIKAAYPRKEPDLAPAEFWPIAGGGLNEPLGPRPVPVEGM